jgi:predicted Zn-dependent protease
LTALLAFTGCAVNPATGQRQFSLIGEGREIRMGQEADPQIVASLGLYDDPALQSYMQGFGGRLAAVSERPQLPWTFRVVDDPVVNAFALPGGFIYITRGIMAHMTSESQLGGVVGHEIGHVTARHSVEQMSRAQLAQVGLVAGMVLAPSMQDYFGAASAGLGLLFLKFGRDDERQSDELGLRYLTRGGYDPRPMPGVFNTLDRVSQASGGGRVPEWMSTHPNPANRAEGLHQQIAALGQDFQNRPSGAESYMDRLDGMVYGPNPREGFFRDNLFLHPDLEFQFAFPNGWVTQNQKSAVVGLSSGKDAMVQVTLASDAASPGDAAQAFLSQEGMQSTRPRSTRVNGLAAVEADFVVTTEQGDLEGAALFVSYGGNVYQLLAYGTSQAWSDQEPAARQSLNSFDRLTDRQALRVQPNRLEVITLDRPMTFERFVEQYPSVVSIEELALINQVDQPSHLVPAGRKLKRVVQGGQRGARRRR